MLADPAEQTKRLSPASGVYMRVVSIAGACPDPCPKKSNMTLGELCRALVELLANENLHIASQAMQVLLHVTDEEGMYPW